MGSTIEEIELIRRLWECSLGSEAWGEGGMARSDEGSSGSVKKWWKSPTGS